ncbi:MAG TPA: helix-turn-helix domain-containing protein [Gemmatimonadaceae bacterium]
MNTSPATEHATDHESRSATHLPMLLNVDEAADLLRTSRRATYAMIARRQLPGVVRIRGRVLVRSAELVDRLHQKRAPSPEELAMSVTIRPYRRGGWEINIRVVTPDGTRRLRERKRAPMSSRSAAMRWAEGRERILFQGLMDPAQHTPRKEAPTRRRK